MLSGLCYLAASLTARYISPVRHHIYVARLLLMLVITGPWPYFWLSHADLAIVNGYGPGPKKIGTHYGTYSIFAWWALSLVSWPGTKRGGSPK